MEDDQARNHGRNTVGGYLEEGETSNVSFLPVGLRVRDLSSKCCARSPIFLILQAADPSKG